jgi:tetratricopeptide (TPR) repeat protein
MGSDSYTEPVPVKISGAGKKNQIRPDLNSQHAIGTGTEKLLLQAGRLNLAICYLKLNNWIEARNVCDKVLEEAPTVAKAWFRRGEANFALNDWEIAKVR